MPWRGAYVFEGLRGLSGVSFCVHDLRRTFATVADSLDIPGYAVKALLNHKGGSDVTAGYIVASTERLREPMQKITDYVLRCGCRGIGRGAAVRARRSAPEKGKTEAMTTMVREVYEALKEAGATGEKAPRRLRPSKRFAKRIACVASVAQA